VELDGRVLTERKTILFGCGCCAGLGQLLTRQAREVIAVAERLADGPLSFEEVSSAYRRAVRGAKSAAEVDAGRAVASLFSAVERHAPERYYRWVSAKVASALGWGVNREPVFVAERKRQAAVFRDLLGNPFQSRGVSTSWLTPTVLALAKQMYDARDFSLMPILADALQDADCDNQDILNHCRDTGLVHVRGCWVVDEVLGKT
jgi:hypothetical protein